MRVLSIDLDYIMSPSIEIYNNLVYDYNPSTRWRNILDHTAIRDNHIYIDQGNLLFCFDTFLKALQNCNSVSFGYEHDSILFDIKHFSNIDLINIDHHDDVFCADYRQDFDFETALQKEYFEICNANRVHDGNWIAWLASQKKINSYTWIGNKNSSCKSKNFFNKKIVPNYLNVERDNYKFDDYKFDHIYVCLSPQYIPKHHWHYFSMFMQVYEQLSGKDAIIQNQKHETLFRHQEIDKIMSQQSEGGCFGKANVTRYGFYEEEEKKKETDKELSDSDNSDN